MNMTILPFLMSVSPLPHLASMCQSENSQNPLLTGTPSSTASTKWTTGHPRCSTRSPRKWRNGLTWTLLITNTGRTVRRTTKNRKVRDLTWLHVIVDGIYYRMCWEWICLYSISFTQSFSVWEPKRWMGDTASHPARHLSSPLIHATVYWQLFSLCVFRMQSLVEEAAWDLGDWVGGRDGTITSNDKLKWWWQKRDIGYDGNTLRDLH